MVNQTIEMYLRHVAGDKLKQWVTWLPWAKYCYNTSFHASLKTSPFQVVYERSPPCLLSYEKGSSCVDAIDKALIDHIKSILDSQFIKLNLDP